MAIVTWRDVDSTAVNKVGWDRHENMYVEFNTGHVYIYPGVTRQQAVAVANAPSVGSYIHRNIKPYYPAIKL